MANTAYDQFVAHIQKIADINYAIGVLHWDKEVNLPPKSAGLRSRQIATLDGMVHQLFSSDKTKSLLQKLEQEYSLLDDQQKKNVSEVHRDFDRAQKFDEAFVIERSKLVSAGYHAWLEARKANDFKLADS